MVIKRLEGYFVKSDQTGQNVGGPYPTRAEAQKRERKVAFYNLTHNRAFVNKRPTSYLQLLAQTAAAKK